MTMQLPPDTQSPALTEADLRRFRAGAHKVDAERYDWLAAFLRNRHPDIASTAERWAREHERLAFELLKLKGRCHG